MKNYGDRGGCYPPRPTASKDNTLLDLHNSSCDTKAEFNAQPHTQPHSLTVKYTTADEMNEFSMHYTKLFINIDRKFSILGSKS